MTDLLWLCLGFCDLYDWATEARLANNAIRGVFEGKVWVISPSSNCSLSGSGCYSLIKLAAWSCFVVDNDEVMSPQHSLRSTFSFTSETREIFYTSSLQKKEKNISWRMFCFVQRHTYCIHVDAQSECWKRLDSLRQISLHIFLFFIKMEGEKKLSPDRHQLAFNPNHLPSPVKYKTNRFLFPFFEF